MCGAPNAEFVILIEGTELKVCSKCARYGKIIRRLHNATRAESKAKRKPVIKAKRTIKEDEEPALTIVDNYGGIVKKARERMGIKQEELGKRIAEKESVIHKIEAGLLKPDIELARKLERFLRIKIVVEADEGDYTLPKNSGDHLTIGDLIRIKKRKG